jgi:hypothetical protein
VRQIAASPWQGKNENVSGLIKDVVTARLLE